MFRRIYLRNAYENPSKTMSNRDFRNDKRVHLALKLLENTPYPEGPCLLSYHWCNNLRESNPLHWTTEITCLISNISTHTPRSTARLIDAGHLLCQHGQPPPTQSYPLSDHTGITASYLFDEDPFLTTNTLNMAIPGDAKFEPLYRNMDTFGGIGTSSTISTRSSSSSRFASSRKSPSPISQSPPPLPHP